jgi:hypothetical protein
MFNDHRLPTPCVRIALELRQKRWELRQSTEADAGHTDAGVSNASAGFAAGSTVADDACGAKAKGKQMTAKEGDEGREASAGAESSPTTADAGEQEQEQAPRSEQATGDTEGAVATGNTKDREAVGDMEGSAADGAVEAPPAPRSRAQRRRLAKSQQSEGTPPPNRRAARIRGAGSPCPTFREALRAAQESEEEGPYASTFSLQPPLPGASDAEHSGVINSYCCRLSLSSSDASVGKLCKHSSACSPCAASAMQLRDASARRTSSCAVCSQLWRRHKRSACCFCSCFRIQNDCLMSQSPETCLRHPLGSGRVAVECTTAHYGACNRTDVKVAAEVGEPHGMRVTCASGWAGSDLDRCFRVRGARSPSPSEDEFEHDVESEGRAGAAEANTDERLPNGGATPRDSQKRQHTGSLKQEVPHPGNNGHDLGHISTRPLKRLSVDGGRKGAKRRRRFERVIENPVNVPEPSAAGLPPLAELLTSAAAAAGEAGLMVATGALLRRFAGMEAAEAISTLTEGLIGLVQQGSVDHTAALDELRKLAKALDVVTGTLGAGGGNGPGLATRSGAAVVSELPGRRRGDACVLRAVAESGLLLRCVQIVSLPVMIVAAIVESGGGATSAGDVKNWRAAELRFLEIVFESITVCFCVLESS